MSESSFASLKLGETACYVRLQVCAGLAGQNVQYDGVGNQLCVIGVLLQGGGESSLSFGEATEMEFSDGLADNGAHGGGAGCRGELLVDVESGLVFLTTLKKKKVPVSFLI